ncbi:MAG: O-antigen ligase family protein [Oscillatoria sp. PMC 1068.18]|nr:O-antigen ligase family protein [Oscillatoria sp. PMC 1076.18]MEC4987685.1 O-antigen ligase family protein [Oscillatoria sp. PMC 1068.18]
MLNSTKNQSRVAKDSFKLTDLSFPEKIVYWTIVLTPVWWLSGVQTLLYPGVAAGLLVYKFDLDKLTRRSLPISAWAWLLMSMAMLITAMLGLNQMGFSIMKAASTIVTFSKSYFLIFCCFTIPFWHQIRLQVVTRAVAWLSVGYAVAIAIELVMLVAGLGDIVILPPLARAIPGDKLSLLVGFAYVQPFFGIPLPRTALYTPDPPILGACSLLGLFICLGESDTRLRRWAVFGSAIALAISQSRISWVSCPMVFFIIAVFRSSSMRQTSLWGISFTSFLCGILGLTISELIGIPLGVFTSARAESSSDRELVVSKTLEAWQDKPWLGWGVIRGSVKWHTFDIALGSFSTYASVLYLHGIFGFVFFIFALASSLWNFWKPALGGNPDAKRGFGTLIALYLLCQGTPLSWMTVYFWFYYLWLGTILAEEQQKHPKISRWEDLAVKTW